MQWLFLIGAIVFEVFGTISLRMAATGQRAYYGAVAVGYLFAFGFLTLTLNEGLGLGVAYGIWAASGVALTAVASKILFKEPLTPIMLGGIALTSYITATLASAMTVNTLSAEVSGLNDLRGSRVATTCHVRPSPRRRGAASSAPPSSR